MSGMVGGWTRSRFTSSKLQMKRTLIQEIVLIQTASIVQAGERGISLKQRCFHCSVKHGFHHVGAD